MRSSTPLNRRRQLLATLPLSAAVSAALSTSALLMPSVASLQRTAALGCGTMFDFTSVLNQIWRLILNWSSNPNESLDET